MEPSRDLTLFLHNSGSVFHIITDMQGRYTYVNELFGKIFSASSGNNIPGEYFNDSLSPDDQPVYRDIIEQLISSPDKTVCADLCRSRQDGSIFWIRWEFFVIIDNKETTGIQAVGTDITERKRAELEKQEVQEKLSRERYLLRTLIDHLPDYIFVKDASSRQILSNRANLEFIGAGTEEEIIGKTAMDYLDEKSAKEQLEKEQLVLSSGKPASTEEYVINKKGEKKWLFTTRVPLKEPDYNIIGLVGIGRDVSRMKNIEESLRRSVERFKLASKATNDAIWDWDLVNDNMVWNDSVVFLFGFTHEEIASDRHWWQNHIHPNDRERVLSKIYAHIEEGVESWQDEYRFICSNGSVKTVLDRGYIVLDKNDKPYRMIGAMMDISERKKLEAELAVTNLARQRLVTEATIMAQEKERSEIGRELHDNINQILTTTKMYLDMALTDKDISEELMIKSHENISTAIEEIRVLSKSLVPPSLGDIGLKTAIAEMVNNLNLSQKINIKLKTSGFAKSSIPANVQLMVFRIVQEQMNNILKHSKATEAHLRLTVLKDKKLLNISISDNGIGFDTRKRAKGIGLMNILSRAELHNGVVEVISSPGNGCTIKISIPV